MIIILKNLSFGLMSPGEKRTHPVSALRSKCERVEMLDKLFIRWVLQPYWRLTRSQTLGVQGIVIDGSNKVLLVRHSYVRGSHLPGGGVERDENLEQALRRELLEEPGIELTRKPCLHGSSPTLLRT